MRIILVAGARPNFPKVAPILRSLRTFSDKFDPILVHTGQHYDYMMSQVFFDELGIPSPDIFLNVGSGTHAEQTGRVMIEFEKILDNLKPDMAMVVGDVNSTLACAVTAKKCQVKLAHVEAGLRSFDRTMPEEINRIMTDSISDFLYTTCRGADAQLLREGHRKENIIFVGNCMIDTLMAMEPKIDKAGALEEFGIQSGNYAVVTLHRPSNVDSAETFSGILDALSYLDERLPVIFPMHPRTQANIERFGLGRQVKAMSKLKILGTLGYIDFLKLAKNSRMVITDSGGIQEETTFLGVPCVTLRENTERPVTVEKGTNVLVGLETTCIQREFEKILSGKVKKGEIPEFWDGKASDRITAHLLEIQ